MASHEPAEAISVRRDASEIRMLDRAAEVFAAKGFDDALTKSLTNDEFTEAKFFRVFGTKKGILREIFNFMWGELYARARAIENAIEDPVARVRAYLELYVEFFREHEHICRAVTSNTYPRDETVQEQTNYHARFQTVVLRSISRAQQQGKLCDPDIPVAIVYHALRGAVSILLNQCYLEKHFDKNGPPSFTIDDVAKHVGDILRGFLKVPGSTITDQIGKELGQYRATILTAKTHLDALEQLEKRMTQTFASEDGGDGKVRRGQRNAKTGTDA